MGKVYDYRRTESDSPFALAYRMAGYIADAQYISDYVGREYGERHAPSVRKVKAMQADHARLREKAARPRYAKAANDDGETFRVRGLV